MPLTWLRTQPNPATTPFRLRLHGRRPKTPLYLHYTANETIGGVEFHSPPASTVPLVSDVSSNFLSRPLDMQPFGLIYAGAQKNIGPAGLTLVIVRRDLIAAEKSGLPSTLDYHSLAAAGSMLNTPPTFAWYVAGLVFRMAAGKWRPGGDGPRQ